MIGHPGMTHAKRSVPMQAVIEDESDGSRIPALRIHCVLQGALDARIGKNM